MAREVLSKNARRRAAKKNKKEAAKPDGADEPGATPGAAPEAEAPAVLTTAAAAAEAAAAEDDGLGRRVEIEYVSADVAVTSDELAEFEKWAAGDEGAISDIRRIRDESRTAAPCDGTDALTRKKCKPGSQQSLVLPRDLSGSARVTRVTVICIQLYTTLQVTNTLTICESSRDPNYDFFF